MRLSSSQPADPDAVPTENDQGMPYTNETRSIAARGGLLTFGPFAFDVDNGLLFRGRAEIPLPPRAVAVLSFLLARRGEVVGKDQILAQVWEDTHVSDVALSQAVSLIRQALDDDPRDPSYIQTVHRRGYRFIAKVRPLPSEGAASVPPATGTSGTEGPDRRLSPGSAGWRPAARSPVPSWRAVVGVVGVATSSLLVLLAVGIWGRWAPGPSTTPAGVADAAARFVVTMPDEASVDAGPGRPPALALSSDGRTLVVSGTEPGQTPRLFHRAMDDLALAPIAGSEGASAPFLHPAGTSVGFAVGDRLYAIPLAGGARTLLAEVEGFAGASWAVDGSVVFASYDAGRLVRVRRAGSSPEVLAKARRSHGERGYLWPQVIDATGDVLFTIRHGSTLADMSVALLSLEDGEIHTLLDGAASARYVPTGHLVFVRDGGLMAASFDPRRPEVRGEPVPVVEDVMTDINSGAAQYAVSDSGDLVYLPGVRDDDGRRLFWLAAGDVPRPAFPQGRLYEQFRLSPDGSRVAASVLEESRLQIHVADLERGTLTRATYDGGGFRPIWSPDGDWIAFSAVAGAVPNVHRMRADGGEPELLWPSTLVQVPSDWSPDGSQIAYVEFHPVTGTDVWIRSADASSPARPLVRTPFAESVPRFSPDGRWIAYHSDESGRHEVYLRSVEAPHRKLQVSASGGTRPVWDPADPSRLLYRRDDAVLAVRVDLGSGAPEVGAPRLFVEAPNTIGDIDLAPGGRRLLLASRGGAADPRQVHVVLGWLEEVRSRVPPVG